MPTFGHAQLGFILQLARGEIVSARTFATKEARSHALPCGPFAAHALAHAVNLKGMAHLAQCLAS